VRQKKNMKSIINRIVFICLLLLIVSCNKTHKEYYENGKLFFKVSLNKNGEYSGIGKYYNEDGKLISEFTYKEGIKEGPAKLYFQNGSVEQIWNYKNGKSHGINKKFDLNGNIVYREIAKNDTVIYYSKFNEKGKLIEERRIISRSIPDYIIEGMKFNIKISISGLLYDKGKSFLSYRLNNINYYNNDLSYNIINEDSLQGNVLLKIDSIGEYYFEGNFRVYDSTNVGFIYDFREIINVKLPISVE